MGLDNLPAVLADADMRVTDLVGVDGSSRGQHSFLHVAASLMITQKSTHLRQFRAFASQRIVSIASRRHNRCTHNARHRHTIS